MKNTSILAILIGITIVCTAVVRCFYIAYNPRVCAVLKVEGLGNASI